MTAASKRRRPPKRGFGESDRYCAWPDRFVWRHVPALPVTDEEVRKIAASLGVLIDSEHVDAVLAAIRRFDGRKTAMAAVPDGDHRARDIDTLGALARAMDGMNANVRAALVRYGIDLGNCEPAQVAEVARQAAKAIKRARIASPRSGRPPKVSRAVTLRELTAIYKQATGRPGKIAKTSGSGITKAGQPTGRFLKFIRAAVSPVSDLKILSDHTLAAAVTRATTAKRR